MNVDKPFIEAHTQSFDRLYSEVLKMESSEPLKHPLHDIDKFDWGRGEYANPYYSYMYRRFSAHIYESMQLSSNCGQVFVLGCGGGADERNISDIYPDISLWSIDISKVMLGVAMKAKTPSQMARASAEALPFPDNCFDRVLSREVIEHVMVPRQMICEISRVLKPGGIAVITTENNDSWAPWNRLYEKYKSLMYKLMGLGDSRKDLGYKDDAPTEREFKEFSAAAKLNIEKYFWDGAIYKFLPCLQGILRRKWLLHLAHFLSRIENNRIVAPILCDQIKYIFKKPEDPDATINDTKFSAPGGGRLKETKDGYVSEESAEKYGYMMTGIPDFLGVSGTGESDNIHEKSCLVKKFTSKWFVGLFFCLRKKMAKGALALYAMIYMLFALTVALICPANTTDRPTRQLAESSKFQHLIRKSLFLMS